MLTAASNEAFPSDNVRTSQQMASPPNFYLSSPCARRHSLHPLSFGMISFTFCLCRKHDQGKCKQKLICIIAHLFCSSSYLCFSQCSDDYGFSTTGEDPMFICRPALKSNQRVQIICIYYNRNSKMEYDLLLGKAKWKLQLQGQWGWFTRPSLFKQMLENWNGCNPQPSARHCMNTRSRRTLPCPSLYSSNSAFPFHLWGQREHDWVTPRPLS